MCAPRAKYRPTFTLVAATLKRGGGWSVKDVKLQLTLVAILCLSATACPAAASVVPQGPTDTVVQILADLVKIGMPAPTKPLVDYLNAQNPTVLQGILDLVHAAAACLSAPTLSCMQGTCLTERYGLDPQEMIGALPVVHGDITQVPLYTGIVLQTSAEERNSPAPLSGHFAFGWYILDLVC